MRKNYKNVSELKKKLSGTNFFFFGKVESTNKFLRGKFVKGISMFSLQNRSFYCVVTKILKFEVSEGGKMIIQNKRHNL